MFKFNVLEFSCFVDEHFKNVTVGSIPSIFILEIFLYGFGLKENLPTLLG